MSSIKNIQAKIEQMEKLKQEIEKTKKNINAAVGENFIKELGLEYEDLSSKKEIITMIKKLKEQLPNNFFKNKELNSNTTIKDFKQDNNNQYSEQPSNHNRNF